MLPPIETARQWIRDCLPQCAAEESEAFVNGGIVYVQEAHMYVNKDCVTRCYEAAKAAFRLAAETGQIATDNAHKVVQVATEQLSSKSHTVVQAATEELTTKNYSGLWTVAALVVGLLILYRIHQQQRLIRM